jgi:hypothetical protein
VQGRSKAIFQGTDLCRHLATLPYSKLALLGQTYTADDKHLQLGMVPGIWPYCPSRHTGHIVSPGAKITSPLSISDQATQDLLRPEDTMHKTTCNNISMNASQRAIELPLSLSGNSHQGVPNHAGMTPKVMSALGTAQVNTAAAAAATKLT